LDGAGEALRHKWEVVLGRLPAAVCLACRRLSCHLSVVGPAMVVAYVAVFFVVVPFAVVVAVLIIVYVVVVRVVVA